MEDSSSALLIIDVQIGLVELVPPEVQSSVLSKIRTLLTKARASGIAVIFIQHDGTKENDFLPGTPDWKILPGLTQEQDDIFINKTANDCFYHFMLYLERQ